MNLPDALKGVKGLRSAGLYPYPACEVASSLPLHWRGQVEMRVGGRYRGVELGVG